MALQKDRRTGRSCPGTTSRSAKSQSPGAAAPGGQARAGPAPAGAGTSMRTWLAPWPGLKLLGPQAGPGLGPPWLTGFRPGPGLAGAPAGDRPAPPDPAGRSPQPGGRPASWLTTWPTSLRAAPSAAAGLGLGSAEGQRLEVHAADLGALGGPHLHGQARRTRADWKLRERPLNGCERRGSPPRLCRILKLH